MAAEIPAIVDRAVFQAELEAVRSREKAHTHEGDAIAAARRRMPMVEVDATVGLIGPHGPVTLLDVFEGREQLIAYYHMWGGPDYMPDAPTTSEPPGRDCPGIGRHTALPEYLLTAVQLRKGDRHEWH